MTVRGDSPRRFPGGTLRIRLVTMYSFYLGLAAIELLCAAAPGGRAYNVVGAVLALSLMVLTA